MRKYFLVILFFLAKQNACFAKDTCTLKASFYPSRDTVVAANYSMVFNSTTTGATSITWLTDGTARTGTSSYSYFTNNAGVNEVALAVSNGVCVDTARMYVVITGTQPVTKDYYKLTLSVPGMESQARAVVKLNSEEYIVGGYQSYPVNEFAFQKKAFIAAMNDDGCIRWSIQTHDGDDHITTHLKKTAGGDILAGVDNRILMRIDANGTIKWLKSLPTTGIVLPSFINFTEDNDGNIIFMYSSTASYNLVKLDANGNTLWARYYSIASSQNLVPSSIVQINNSYYVCGAVLQGGAGSANSDFSFLAKVDAATGATQWSKTSTGAGGQFMTGIFAYNNQLLVNGAATKQSLLYYDLDGNFLNGYNLTAFAANGTTPLTTVFSELAPLPGGDLLWFIKSSGVLLNTTTYQFNNTFLRIRNGNQIAWQQNLANNENDQFYNMVEGKNGSMVIAGNAAAVSNGNAGTAKEAALIKIASNGGFNPVCDAMASNFTMSNVVPTTVPVTWSAEAAYNITLSNAVLPFEKFSLQRKWICPAAVDTCSLLKIKGPNIICDTGKDYTYRIHKTGDCGATIRVTNGVHIKVITDSTLIVSFTEKGKQVIHLSLAGSCLALEDSISINVSATSIDLIPNATICSSDSVVFKLPDGYAGFGISPNTYISTSTTSQIVVRPQTNTTYVLSLKKTTGCDLFDTAVITLLPVNAVKLGNDTIICKGASYTVSVANPVYKGYQWSTGSTGPEITIKEKGSYWVKVTDKNNCTYSDTIEIKDLQSATFFSKPADSVLCSGRTITWNAPTGMQKIVWQDGSTNNSFVITRAGKYWLTVTDNAQCSSSDTLVILRTINAPARFLTSDSSICRNDSIILKSNVAFEKYLWNTGSTQPTISVYKAGTYSLAVTDIYHCEWNQRATITVQDCVNTIFFPGAFTPNKDGLNDQFRPKAFGRLQSFHMDIYNRWGQKIFSTDDWVKGWDGTINKVLQNQNTYVWIAQYQFPGESMKTEKGTFVLMR